MADQLANHLRRKLAAYERAGLTEQVKLVKAKLATVEAAEGDDSGQGDDEAAEVEAPDLAAVDVSGYHVGGGWYEIGDEKVRGEEAARALLEGQE
jgi:hypothetical protein